jgi:nuclear pore complex protein Nup188
LLPQTATVTASEKSSLGTLFDLCSYSIDTLRSSASSSTSPPPFPSPSPFPSLPPTSPVALRSACAETLETSLLLASTQLALHAKSNHGGAALARTLGELGSEVVELVDKAAGTAVVPGGKEDPKVARNRKALLEVLKSKLAVWV